MPADVAVVLNEGGVLRAGRTGVAPDEHVPGHPAGDQLPIQMAPAAGVLGARWVRSASHQLRMLTALATTSPIVTSAVNDWPAMRALAIGVSGMVSVGLKAVALVNDV